MAAAGGYLYDADRRSLSANSGTCHDWNRARLDKTGQRGFGNPDVSTNVDELDSPLRDQTANETRARIQQFSRLVHCQKAIHAVSLSLDRGPACR